jgi:hypothetical protein
MNLKALIILLFNCALIASPVLADQFDPELLDGIDTKVSHISSGGFWKQGENSGTCRAIVKNLCWEHTRSYIHLQWLKTDDEKKTLIEFVTIQIPEFNTGDWQNVLNIEYKNETFSIYYVLRNQKKIQIARLKPELPGKYKITL